MYVGQTGIDLIVRYIELSALLAKCISRSLLKNDGSTKRESREITEFVRFQPYAALQMRSALLYHITQRRVVNPHRRIRTTYWSYLQGDPSCPETSESN
jgi:hypothetical protein